MNRAGVSAYGRIGVAQTRRAFRTHSRRRPRPRAFGHRIVRHHSERSVLEFRPDRCKLKEA